MATCDCFSKTFHKFQIVAKKTSLTFGRSALTFIPASCVYVCKSNQLTWELGKLEIGTFGCRIGISSLWSGLTDLWSSILKGYESVNLDPNGYTWQISTLFDLFQNFILLRSSLSTKCVAESKCGTQLKCATDRNIFLSPSECHRVYKTKSIGVYEVYSG